MINYRGKGESSLHKGTIIASLDLLIQILEDPRWKKRAKNVRTLKDMRQMILDFCKAHGRTMKLDKETLCAFVQHSFRE
jgi:hypothetical protein